MASMASRVLWNINIFPCVLVLSLCKSFPHKVSFYCRRALKCWFHSCHNDKGKHIKTNTKHNTPTNQTGPSSSDAHQLNVRREGEQLRCTQTVQSITRHKITADPHTRPLAVKSQGAQDSFKGECGWFVIIKGTAAYLLIWQVTTINSQTSPWNISGIQ